MELRSPCPFRSLETNLSCHVSHVLWKTNALAKISVKLQSSQILMSTYFCANLLLP